MIILIPLQDHVPTEYHPTICTILLEAVRCVVSIPPPLFLSPPSPSPLSPLPSSSLPPPLLLSPPSHYCVGWPASGVHDDIISGYCGDTIMHSCQHVIE